MHSDYIGSESMPKPDDVLSDYINGLFRPIGLMTASATEHPTIARHRSPVPLWKTLNRPEQALIAALFMLELSRELTQGRLKHMILAESKRALDMVLDNKSREHPQ